MHYRSSNRCVDKTEIRRGKGVLTRLKWREVKMHSLSRDAGPEEAARAATVEGRERGYGMGGYCGRPCGSQWVLKDTGSRTRLVYAGGVGARGSALWASCFVSKKCTNAQRARQARPNHDALAAAPAGCSRGGIASSGHALCIKRSSAQPKTIRAHAGTHVHTHAHAHATRSPVVSTRAVVMPRQALAQRLALAMGHGRT